MKAFVASLFLVAGVGLAHAQAPAETAAGAPAGSTGQCKDGTFSDAPSKRGACAGHKGVKAWFQADAAAAARPGAPVPAASGSTAPAPSSTPATPAPSTPAPSVATSPAARRSMPTTAVAGGGNGQVWVNSASKVYHCEGTKYYGKTKAGSYMTESAAVAAGNHADHGKACKPA